jgi:inner membrane protein
VAFHVLFVADPFYTIWLLLSCLALLILKKGKPARKYWVRFGLACSCIYLLYCITNKVRIDARVKKDLQRQGIYYTSYLSTPTPLNNWLWYVVAADSGGFHTGYRSMFDHQPTHFRWLPRNDSLLAPFRGHKDVGYLLRFANGYYTVEQWGDTLVFNDLRFGEIRGWADPKARFVFHYFLQYPGNNGVVVQRGRMTGWDRRTIRVFIRRIKGN